MKTATMLNLVEAMKALGWAARAEGETLRVEENPKLRSPEIRTDTERVARYVWDGYTAWKPESMAKRLDSFLRECGFIPFWCSEGAPK